MDARKKESTESPGVPEEARRATGGAPGERAEDRGRFSSLRKMEAVLRLIRGESLDALSRELGVTGATLGEWREKFCSGGQAVLKSRPSDERPSSRATRSSGSVTRSSVCPRTNSPGCRMKGSSPSVVITR